MLLRGIIFLLILGERGINGGKEGEDLVLGDLEVSGLIGGFRVVEGDVGKGLVFVEVVILEVGGDKDWDWGWSLVEELVVLCLEILDKFDLEIGVLFKNWFLIFLIFWWILDMGIVFFVMMFFVEFEWGVERYWFWFWFWFWVECGYKYLKFVVSEKFFVWVEEGKEKWYFNY